MLSQVRCNCLTPWAPFPVATRPVVAPRICWSGAGLCKASEEQGAHHCTLDGGVQGSVRALTAPTAIALSRRPSQLLLHKLYPLHCLLYFSVGLTEKLHWLCLKNSLVAPESIGIQQLVLSSSTRITLCTVHHVCDTKGALSPGSGPSDAAE